MKRLKYSIALLIIMTIIFTLFTPAVATFGNGAENGYPANGASNGDNGDEPSDPNGYGDTGLEERIHILEEMLAVTLAFLNELATAGEADRASIDRQIRETADLERFMFQLEYYNLCSIIASNGLLSRQIALTERQLELERVRLSLGFSTQNNVDALSAHLNSLKRQYELNDGIIQIRKPRVNALGSFEIPTPVLPTARTADELRTALIRNNATLFVLDRQINQMNRQGASSAEIRLMRTQRDSIVRQLEMAATSGWSAYLTAKAQYDIAQAARPLLTARLDLLDEMFRIGEISAVARLEQRYAVYEELHGADMAAIALAVAVAELDVMMIGVVGQ